MDERDLPEGFLNLCRIWGIEEEGREVESVPADVVHDIYAVPERNERIPGRRRRMKRMSGRKPD